MMKFLFRLFVKLTGFLSVWLYFKPRVRHEKKKPRYSTVFSGGAAVIVTNHRDQMDFILMLLLFPLSYVRCVVGKTFYECNGFITFMLNMLGAIKVDRFSFDMDFFHKCMGALKKGHKVLIFPEGKFSKEETLGDFKPSAVLLALQSGAPIVPIYHTKNYGLFRSVKTAVGSPIDLREHCQSLNPDSEQLAMLTEMVRDKMLELQKLCVKAAGDE